VGAPELAGRALRWIYRTLSSININPQQLKFPFALWTAAMVQTLIAEHYKVRRSHSSVCRLLHQLGFERTAAAVAGASAESRAVKR
jgi:transposase